MSVAVNIRPLVPAAMMNGSTKLAMLRMGYSLLRFHLSQAGLPDPRTEVLTRM